MPKPNTKTQLARDLGISRSMLYYQPKQPKIDEGVKTEIKTVLAVKYPIFQTPCLQVWAVTLADSILRHCGEI